MSGEPVNGWDERVAIGSESAFGTPLAPNSATVFQIINCNTGPTELGDTRPVKDRAIGRGMQTAFVEGRVKPLAFQVDTSVKSRSAIDVAAKEAILYKAAGLGQTLNSSTNAVYNLGNTPIESTTLASMCLYRIFGTGAAAYEAEQLRGGVIQSLEWTGGDKELMLSAKGVANGKFHLGYIESVTLADGSGTTLSVTSEQAYRLSAGYYAIESEVIRIAAVTDINYSTGSITIARAQLSTTGAAHTGAIMRPYVPSISYAGSPISEANTTCALDSQTMRIMSFGISLKTGIDLLPGESGSKYVQGLKVVRYDITGTLKMVLHREDVALLGKVTQRKSVALTIVCGTGTGGIVTFSLPYIELNPFTVPDTNQDTSIVDVSFRCKDSSGADMMSITQT